MILIFLVLAFYQVFKGVDQNPAVQVILFGGVTPTTIYFSNVVNDLGALMIVRGADFLSVFDKPQQDALAMLFLGLHNLTNTGAEILWGVWLFPLGPARIQIEASAALPRRLADHQRIRLRGRPLHGRAGAGVPRHRVERFLPITFGEVALMLSLVIKGAKPQPREAAA